MATFDLGQRVKVLTKHPDIDDRYGLYNSVTEALANNSPGSREKGRTVGILEAGKVVEYWFESGITDSDLVKKNKGGSGELTPVFITASMTDIGALETETQDSIDQKFATWIESQGFIIPEGEIWFFELLREGSDSGGSSNLTLEQARQNGNVLEGDVRVSDNLYWELKNNKNSLIFNDDNTGTELRNTYEGRISSLAFSVDKMFISSQNNNLFQGILADKEYNKQGDRKAFAQMSDVYDNIGEGGVIELTKELPFSQLLNFTYLQTIMSKNVTNVINFEKNITDAKAGYSCLVRLLANGIDEPTFVGFRKIAGSTNYLNIAGVLNLIFFYYDGTDIWYNIIQDDNGLPEETPEEPETPGPITQVTFDKLSEGGTSYDPITNILNVYTGDRGALNSIPIVLKNNMEFIQRDMPDSVLLVLTDSPTEVYSYSPTNPYIIGVFRYGMTAAYADVSATIKTTVNPNITITGLKIVKNGNNADCYYTTDGVTWVKYYTELGCFYGLTEVYIKVIPVNSGSTKVTRTT